MKREVNKTTIDVISASLGKADEQDTGYRVSRNVKGQCKIGNMPGYSPCIVQYSAEVIEENGKKSWDLKYELF